MVSLLASAVHAAVGGAQPGPAKVQKPVPLHVAALEASPAQVAVGAVQPVPLNVQ